MDEDEETKSHASHESEDKTDDQASPPSGIVTVTVASTAPPPSSPASLTLALPIQNNTSRPILTPTPIQSVMFSGGGSGGGGGGRDDVWSDKATSILIDAWGERYMELSRGNLKQKHWQEVADIINSSGEYGKALKTDVQCKNRIDTVKKKFKVEKAKVVGGGGASQWQFYDRLDRLIAPPPTPTPTPTPSSKVSVSPSQEAAIPVGIPFGGRPHLPVNLVNYYNSSAMPLQHHQPQPPPQPLRHNFPNPISQQRFNFPNNNNNNYSNVNSSGRQHQMLLQQQLQNLQHHQQQMIRRPPPAQAVEMEVESEDEGLSGDSGDSLPPETGYESRKKGREGMNVNVSGGVKKGKRKGKGKKAVKVWGNSVRELTRAILKFGEAYETAESAKLEHILEMEKERMKFAKELELQRMKFLMKTQLELSQLNSGGGGGSDSQGGTSSGRRGGNGGGGGVESNHAH